MVGGRKRGPRRAGGACKEGKKCQGKVDFLREDRASRGKKLQRETADRSEFLGLWKRWETNSLLPADSLFFSLRFLLFWWLHFISRSDTFTRPLDHRLPVIGHGWAERCSRGHALSGRVAQDHTPLSIFFYFCLSHDRQKRPDRMLPGRRAILGCPLAQNC